MNTVRHLIDSGAEQHPEKIYLTSAETGQTLSWGALQQHARSINAYLEQQEIPMGATVVYLLDNGYWTTLLLLGVMYSGRVLLALNALSGKNTLSYVLGHSDAQLVFASPHYQQVYSDVFSQLDEAVKIISSDAESGPQIVFGKNEAAVSANIDAQDTALLIYTSGTTGVPKGVMLSHANVVAGGRNTAVAHQLNEQDIAMCVLPLYHINAQMVSVMGALVSRGHIVIAKKFSTRRFWHDIADYQCTWFSVVPTIISYLIEHKAAGVSDLVLQQTRDRLRFGRSASAALSPAKHKQFEELFGIPIIETMGLSETAAQILSNPMPPAPIKYGSPGMAVGNEAKIIDADGNNASVGVTGELMIRGDNVMQRYYKNESASHQALEADGWLHTGDLAYQDEDGFFFITGRLKELIIKGGENIAPREIDDVLYHHPAVLEAAAFGIDDEHYGQEVMACVALCPGMQVSEQELVDLCISQLGEYKAPKQVLICDELPKGPSGKIQRLKLSA